MLQLIDRRRRLARQVFHGVGIAQPVRPLDGVIHVPLPVIRTHVAQACRNAALRRHRVRTGRKHFGNTGGLETLLGHAERGAKTGSTGTNDNHIKLVVGIFVCFRCSHLPVSLRRKS